MKQKQTIQPTTPNQDDSTFPGYKQYPANEDIYQQTLKSKHEDVTENVDEDDLMHASLDENLDVPGSELDDDDELIGSEDEENNYYSLGGDLHSDLDETDGGID